MDRMVRKINSNLAELFDQKQQNLFCDITLVATADGTGIRAHRNVLHTASAYFKTLLTINMKEKSLEEIPLDGVSGAALHQLIDYAYTQHIDIDASNVEDILAAADLFLLDDVAKMCERIYLPLIDASNAFQILGIAEKYRLVDLEQNARMFTYDHFIEIVEGETFVGWDAGTVVGYLGMDEINTNSEEDIFNAIARWIEADPEERKQHYAALMKTVRMSEVDNKFLHNRILKCSREMDMSSVYMDACAEKSRQDVEVTDKERTVLFKYMFAAGHLANDGGLQIERYSSGSNSWEDVRNIAEITHAHIHFIDNCLYLFERGGGGKLMRMPLSTMQLETRQPMNNHRDWFASVAVGQYVYLIGNLTGDASQQSVVRYGTKNDVWMDMAMLNQGRYGAAAVALAGKVYVVGGNGVQAALRSVERYDPETNQWTNVAELNVARAGHGCCTIKRSIYAVGGCKKGGRLASIEKYDAQLDQWTIIEHGLDVPRSCFGVAAHGAWIYVAGGFQNDANDTTRSNAVRKINVCDGRSEELAPMNHDMMHASAAITH